jgi:Domain of unknown function (DUF1794).
MVFQIPEGLAPETYPLAWLVGVWKGAGILEYEGIEASAYVHEMTIDNDDGGPYLHVESRVWLANEGAEAVDREERGSSAYSRLTKDALWTRISGYVRAAPGVEKHGDATVVEAVSANPAGHAVTWAGLIEGPRLQLAADAIAGVPTASAFESAKAVAGLVQSDLFYAYDIAAFGHEMRSYMAGRLSRSEVA